MDESEFRSFWMALGAALFAGGLVVGVSSGVTVGLTQLPHGVPPLAYWAVIGSFVIAIGGVIIIAMAANDGPL
jgi:lysozyme family protein